LRIAAPRRGRPLGRELFHIRAWGVSQCSRLGGAQGRTRR